MADLEQRVTVIEAELKHLATKAWVLGGVVSGMGLAALIASTIVRNAPAPLGEQVANIVRGEVQQAVREELNVLIADAESGGGGGRAPASLSEPEEIAE